MTRTVFGFIVMIAVLWASNAITQTAEPQPAAKIVVDPPLAEPLSRGVVFIQYRTENLQIVMVFGPQATRRGTPAQCFCAAKLWSCPCLSWVKSGRENSRRFELIELHPIPQSREQNIELGRISQPVKRA